MEGAEIEGRASFQLVGLPLIQKIFDSAKNNYGRASFVRANQTHAIALLVVGIITLS